MPHNPANLTEALEEAILAMADAANSHAPVTPFTLAACMGGAKGFPQETVLAAVDRLVARGDLALRVSKDKGRPFAMEVILFRPPASE